MLHLTLVWDFSTLESLWSCTACWESLGTVLGASQSILWSYFFKEAALTSQMAAFFFLREISHLGSCSADPKSMLSNKYLTPSAYIHLGHFYREAQNPLQMVQLWHREVKLNAYAASEGRWLTDQWRCLNCTALNGTATCLTIFSLSIHNLLTRTFFLVAQLRQAGLVAQKSLTLWIYVMKEYFLSPQKLLKPDVHTQLH